MLEIAVLLLKTILLRPYVFLFLAAFLFSAHRLLGWRRTGWFFLIGWITAFLCEFSSTRTGIPFGLYYYTGSTTGQELYISNVPFMDSLSFTFLLYASYCMALLFLLPAESQALNGRRPLRLRFDLETRTSWPVLLLTALFYAFIDVVIDPVALRGGRWFLGQIYGYAYPGIYFGVPIENFIGWAVVGLIALSVYDIVDRKLPRLPDTARTDLDVTKKILLGCGLYYGVLAFNVAITFWIGEPLLGVTGLFIYLPITAFFFLRLVNKLPTSHFTPINVPRP
ncbi:MAG TPA: carotenoid biosynthesis protein [Nitrospiraceae bacterium]|jgi:putative membrane protein|nr:carotenoid biosynthesis protein [Nitrospiraceae bacterium]